MVTVKVEVFSLTVSCDCYGKCSSVVDRVGEKTWGEPAPELLVVVRNRFREMTVGTADSESIGKRMEVLAIGSADLFNFPLRFSSVENKKDVSLIRWYIFLIHSC